MNKKVFKLSALIITLFVCSGLHTASGNISAPQEVNDTIHNKSKKEHREQEKHNFEHSHKRAFVKVSFVYTKLIIKTSKNIL